MVQSKVWHDITAWKIVVRDGLFQHKVLVVRALKNAQRGVALTRASTPDLTLSHSLEVVMVSSPTCRVDLYAQYHNNPLYGQWAQGIMNIFHQVVNHKEARSN